MKRIQFDLQKVPKIVTGLRTRRADLARTEMLHENAVQGGLRDEATTGVGAEGVLIGTPHLNSAQEVDALVPLAASPEIVVADLAVEGERKGIDLQSDVSVVLQVPTFLTAPAGLKVAGHLTGAKETVPEQGPTCPRLQPTLLVHLAQTEDELVPAKPLLPLRKAGTGLKEKEEARAETRAEAGEKAFAAQTEGRALRRDANDAEEKSELSGS
mmetsp:Transcript_48984/g.96051  ORF Transcript_48984/g.96051 Transcript_48984/m.96051 type:complete len:213 (-) Transcript_48984:4204-4842(-)